MAGRMQKVIPVLQDSVLFSGKSLEAQILYGQLAQQELSGGALTHYVSTHKCSL